MEGIVSLLDDAHYKLTEQLWAELAQQFGVNGVTVTPYPHFSYHVAPGYAPDEAVDAALAELARATTPFTVSTSGLGLFTGASPVLYVPVVRTAALSKFHQRVWEALEGLCFDPLAYYQSEHWLPHITIGFGDLRPDKLAAIVPFLSQHDFSWAMTIDNLAFFADRGEGQKVRRRFEFGESNGSSTTAA